MKFIQWLFSDFFSEIAKCQYCGDTVSKSRMVHATGHGWFCNADEADQKEQLFDW